MNFEFEKRWRETVANISKNFGEEIDLQSILFLIGLQELDLRVDKLSKDQKIEVIHVAICTLLEPYGYYESKGLDSEGWPHFEPKQKIPNVNETEQEQIIKEAIIDYFS
jgi:hypothetical protein